MKKIAGYIFIALLIAGISSAVEENHAEIFAQAKQLIDARTSCENLSDDQLEMIGEYYMEQMHPGDAHERMDEMMGGEGSETLRIMHIRMAKALYCGESQMMGSGMMGMMMNGMMGCARRRMVSSTRTRVRRVARCCASLPFAICTFASSTYQSQ